MLTGQSCPTPATAGVTLIELVTVIAIVAILLAIAAPSFQSFILNARLTGEAQKMLSALQTARSEAARRNASVVLCPSANRVNCGTNWNNSKIVFADTNGNARANGAELIFVAEPGPSSNTVTPSRQTRLVQFNSSGQVEKPLLTGALTFTFCDTRTAPAGRQITIERTGRATLSLGGC